MISVSFFLVSLSDYHTLSLRISCSFHPSPRQPLSLSLLLSHYLLFSVLHSSTSRNKVLEDNVFVTIVLQVCSHWIKQFTDMQFSLILLIYCLYLVAVPNVLLWITFHAAVNYLKEKVNSLCSIDHYLGQGFNIRTK